MTVQNTLKIDVASAAEMLIDLFPGKGHLRALERAGMLLDGGDFEGAAEWARVAATICERELSPRQIAAAQ